MERKGANYCEFMEISFIKKTCLLFILLSVLIGTLAPPPYQKLTVKITKAATHTLAPLTQSSSQISLTWTQNPDATGYHVYRTTNQGMTRLTGVSPLSSATSTYNDSTNIKDGVLYQYEVAAIINGQEVFSNAQAIYSKISPSRSTAPITATAGSNYVDLTFSPSSSDDIAYYVIYRNGEVVGATIHTTYRDIGITSSTTFTYSIKAVDYDGLKSESYNQISVATLARPAGPAIQSITLLTQDFHEQWKKNPSSSLALQLGTQAIWTISGSNQMNTTSAELSNSFPIYPSTYPAEVKFNWTKTTSNSAYNPPEKLDIFLDYMAPDGPNWENKWSETSTFLGKINSLSGTQTVQITNTPGKYSIRFRATLTTSNQKSTIQSIIDNVVVTQQIPNVIPLAPSSFDGKAGSSNLVNLNWKTSGETDIVGYKILRKFSADATYSSTPIATKNATSYVDPTAQPNTSYTYKIVAVDGGNLESQGIEVTVKTPETLTTKDTIPPEPAGNLKTNTIGTASAELLWLPSPTSDLKGYCLLRSTDGINYAIVKQIAVLTTIDKVLQANTDYYYRIIGIDSAGNPSAPSNLLKIKTKIPDTEAPTKPSEFSVDFTGETYIKFKWNPSIDNDRVDRYIIEQYESGWVQKGVFYSPAMSGTIQGLVPGNTYEFRIKAVDTSNNESSLAFLTNPTAATTKVDTTPPKITFKIPAKGDKQVGTKEALLIRFDDVIKKESVNPLTLKVIYNQPTASLAYVPGETIDGTYQFNSETNPTEVQFVPTEPLQTDATYQVMVSGVENISGTTIENSTWLFTTGTSEYNQPHGNYTDTTVFCSSCHNTHDAVKPRLLNKSIENVCFSCHNGTGSSMNVQVQLINGETEKFSHHPVLENKPGKEEGVQQTCTSCHNPHDGGKDLDTGTPRHLTRLLNPLNKGNIYATIPVIPKPASQGNEVCWNCHGDEGSPQYSQGYLTGGEIINPPYLSGSSYEYRTDHQTYYPKTTGHASTIMDSKKGGTDGTSGTNINCVACHEKHGSEVKPLLRNNIAGNDPIASPIVNGKEFCYQCHKDPLDITNADNQNPATKSYDGQVVNEGSGHAQFDCQVCHNPHGSPYPNYLRLNYQVDTTVQKNFELKDAELCFDCHDENKLKTKGAVISGSEGSENLHGSHLSSTGQSQCKDCHRPHGAIATENANSNVSHKVGFPSTQVTGTTIQYIRDAIAANPIEGGSGSCNLNCHGKEHNGSNYDGAFREGTGIAGFTNNNAFMLKDNWKIESVLLNTRPDGTSPYIIGDYPIDYRNGPIINGTKTHFRDTEDNGKIMGDGYLWK